MIQIRQYPFPCALALFHGHYRAVCLLKPFTYPPKTANLVASLSTFSPGFRELPLKSACPEIKTKGNINIGMMRIHCIPGGNLNT
jgi:hypothetical protein